MNLKCYCDQKSILRFFFVFQNYVTEQLSVRSFKPSFHKDLFILTEIFLINGPLLLTLKSWESWIEDKMTSKTH